jgi:phage portal protein BeeE
MTSLLAEAVAQTESVVSLYQKQIAISREQLVDVESEMSNRSGLGVSTFSSDSGDKYKYFRHWVFVCIDKIAGTLAGQPWRAAELTNAPDNPERTPQDLWLKNVPQRIQNKATSAEELQVLPSHPVIDLLDQPNGHQHSYEFLYFTVANLELVGVAYWILGTDDDGSSERLFAVPATWMKYNRKQDIYKLKVPGNFEGVPIPPECVGKVHFPNPSDPLSHYSPLNACLSAIKTDDYIQTSQHQSYEKGIHPNLIVSVGKTPGTQERPVLTGAQRRQFIRAIRELMNQSISVGDPAIVDGMIDSITKLQTSPQEMDWPASGEIVKKRIVQTYGINPYVFGEISGVNRAQASVAKDQFYETIINPLAGSISNAMTSFLGPKYETPKRLIVYLEEAKAIDREQRLREWSTMRRTDDVTQEEYRAAILGLGPLEEREDPSSLLSLVGGLTGITSLQSQVAQGLIGADEAIALLVRILRVSEEDARAIIGAGPQPRFELPEPEPQQALPPPIEEEEEEDEPDDDKSLLDDHIKRFSKAEEDMGQSLARYFCRQPEADCGSN